MARPFVDTNVFLRHLLQDDADHSPRATSWLRRIETGEVVAQTTEIAVFEATYTLERRLKVPRALIRDAMVALLEPSGLVLANKNQVIAAFEIYVAHRISFADAYHAVLCRENGWSPVVSFDRDFDRIEGVTRVEP